MANSVLNPSVIAKESLMQLKNNTVMGNLVHREYKKEFKKVGDTVSIRKPVKFVTSDGATRVNQDVEEGNTSVTINSRKHVSWNFSTQDLTLSIEEYSKRYIEPAMITLAQTLDQGGFGLYKDVWNQVGTPGTTPDTFAKVSPSARRLDEMAVMSNDRNLVLNPEAHYGIAGDQVGLQNQAMVKTAYEAAKIGRIAGLNTYSSNNIKTHTVGAHGGTPLVAGGSQETTYALSKTTNTQSLVTDGWTNSTAVLKAGDVFTIAGVYAVNPVPGEGSTGKTAMNYLQQFTVTADATSDGSGNATLTIAPAIIVSGPYQTVSAAPADNAAITVMGTASTAYPMNMAFHKNAFALVTCPLEMPDGVAWKGQESSDGLSVRVVKDYDIDTDQDVIRLDILYGWKSIYPDLAARLVG